MGHVPPPPTGPKVLVVSLWHDDGTVWARLLWARPDERWPAGVATAVVRGRVCILDRVRDLTIQLLEEVNG